MRETENSGIGAMMMAALRTRADRPALIMPHFLLSAAQLVDAAQVHARSLETAASHGAAAILANTKAGTLARFLAAQLAQRPALLLDPAWPDAELAEVAARLRPGAIAAERELGGLSPALSQDYEPSCVPLVFRRKLNAAPVLALDPSDFYWGLSSGTTGYPKAFARSHASWVASFAACEAVFPFHAADCIAIPGALQHSLFLYGAIHALARGFPVAAMDRFTPAAAMRHFARCGASVLYCVPAMLHSFLEAGFGAWRPRVIFSGGARVSAVLRHAVETALPETELVEFYGSSEMSFVSYASSSQPAPAGSAGLAFPGVDIKIEDAIGDAPAPFAGGVIAVRSPMVFSRYLDGNRQSITNGWHKSGDLGYLDAKGYLYITGRQSRIINTSGLKLSPEPIEEVLRACPGVLAAAVVGMPHEKRGEVIAAVIVPAKDFAGVEALSLACRKHLPLRQLPRCYYLADALPMTRSGKIAVKTLERRLAAGDTAFKEIRR